MMTNTIEALRTVITKPFNAEVEAINCYHNYVARENHYGENVFITRKGAVRAQGWRGDYPWAWEQNRLLYAASKRKAFAVALMAQDAWCQEPKLKTRFNWRALAATKNVECHKDADVIDETPSAYKNDDVMTAQKDLVEVVYTWAKLCVWKARNTEWLWADERVSNEVNGGMGEGGGQILRSSLTLSMVTGKPFTMKNIRHKRKTPGLLRQHLTAVKASAQICDAKVTGAQLKSTNLTFIPNKVRSGQYEFAIGTAGSTNLVAQTLLPALMLSDWGSHVVIHGRTHNSLTSTDFLRNSFLPQLLKMGYCAEITLENHSLTRAVVPSPLKPSPQIKHNR